MNDHDDHDDHDAHDEHDGHDGQAANFRSRHYWIARTAGACPQCHGTTGRVALMLPPRHEALSIDDEDEDAPLRGAGAIGCDRWECVPRHAFLFYVECLPDEVRRRLQRLAPAYRLAPSQANQGSYWANHCAQCGAFQEDHELFCEPEGAFSPVSPATAASIELLAVPEPLEVSAAGYVLDPEFVLDCPRVELPAGP